MNFASLFSQKANKWVEGRKNWRNNVLHTVQDLKNEFWWFHCASLGEFEQARPLIETLKLQKNDIQILLTFYSPSGYEIRKNYEHATIVMYLPVDTPGNASYFFSTFNIKAAFIIKYEFWYHFIHTAHKKKIPLYLISAVFRPTQPFFKPYGGLYRHMLRMFTIIFVQSEMDKMLLGTISIPAIVSGDTRFDRVTSTAENIKDIPLIKRFKGTNRLWVAGSVWRQDVDVVLPVLNELYLNAATIGKLKTIIAPHEISEATISYIEKKLKRPHLRYSAAGSKDLSLYDVLIIDNIGMLASIYRYGDIAYVGGAFSHGLHNILEPAVFGIPILFGASKLAKNRESFELIKAGGAYSVSHPKDFEQKFYAIVSDKEKCKSMGESAKLYIATHKGASENILSNFKMHTQS